MVIDNVAAVRNRSIALVVLAGALVLSTALGIRQTFGLYIGPITGEHLVGVGLLSFALALPNLMWGLAQPFAGGLTDRFGPGPVVAGGAVVYAIGLLAVALQRRSAAIPTRSARRPYIGSPTLRCRRWRVRFAFATRARRRCSCSATSAARTRVP